MPENRERVRARGREDEGVHEHLARHDAAAGEAVHEPVDEHHVRADPCEEATGRERVHDAPREPAPPIEWSWDGINRQPDAAEGAGEDESAGAKAEH